MATDRVHPVDLLARADVERAAGRGAEAAALYDAAVLAARAADDLEVWTRAALGAASVQVFGAEPGRLPSTLYDLLARTTDPGGRASVASALARCWVYAGEAGRAEQFSNEAVARARETGDPVLLADALDAALAVNWGPDQFAVRRELASELAELAAHLPDLDARLQAHLWGLHVACEDLDVQAMHRQMRALEHLGEESPRARFFAATRRVMLDLLRGRSDTAPHLLGIAQEALDASYIPDGWMVIGSLDAYAGEQAGDTARVVAMAVPAEEFAIAEGVRVVHAEAAYCWVAAGELDRAAALIRTFHGGVLESLPRDMNWLLTQHLVLEVALAIGDLELVSRAADLLAPYAGRAVVNGGAVMFHGTTDDTLARAFAVLGRPDEAAELRDRALQTYQRIGASWWYDRLLAAPVPSQPAPAAGRPHLCPVDGGLWLVGSSATPVAGLRGMTYLRELISQPGRTVAALDLVGAGGPVVVEDGLGEVADRQALDAYRQRLVELDAELAEAEEWADPGRIEAAQDERSALLDEVGRVTGLGGRSRTTGSSQERARVAVKKAITGAIDRIAAVDDSLARHLSTHVRTGLLCSYEPEPESRLEWVLSAP